MSGACSWSALSEFQETLEHSSGRKLKLRINDNRSTMLSVRWGREYTTLSIHRIFLEAPKLVIEGLSKFLRGGKNRALPPPVKAYIEERLRGIDYSHTLSPSRLQTKGEVYDLDEIYREINERYFEGKVNLSITWFGTKGRLFRSRVNFGMYVDTQKLVKIHRTLDDATIPRFVVAFVIYHEMLHHICPPIVTERGVTTIHTKCFRNLEMQHEAYKAAETWIEDNKERFFVGHYGWT